MNLCLVFFWYAFFAGESVTRYWKEGRGEILDTLTVLDGFHNLVIMCSPSSTFAYFPGSVLVEETKSCTADI
jgi:hypothetical protein